MEDYEKREAIEKEARDFWRSFVEEITYHNRFNPQHPLTSFLRNYLQDHSITVSVDTILYRARIIKYDPSSDDTGLAKHLHQIECEDFEGYDEKNSFVPPANVVAPGRANPERIVYLYTAKEIITAIGETRPRIFDHISVAKIKLLKDSRFADFTSTGNADKLSLDSAKLSEIIGAFSKPCREEIDYIPTQFVAEFVKSLGYDGIYFASSFVPGGTNITIFDPTIAKAIASAPYRMDSITYRARRIFPLKDLDTFDIVVSNKTECDRTKLVLVETRSLNVIL